MFQVIFQAILNQSIFCHFRYLNFKFIVITKTYKLKHNCLTLNNRYRLAGRGGKRACF